jgi:hypothetical protein
VNALLAAAILSASHQLPGAPPERNLALTATAAASSESAATGQIAAKVNDGIVGGYPDNPKAEWASLGERDGAWVQLTWPDAQAIARIELHDRLNLVDRVTVGVLEFSDGTSLEVPALPNDGSAQVISIEPRSVTWVRFRVARARGENTGLAEFKVF